MSENKSRIVLQRKNPKKPFNWCDWDWIYKDREASEKEQIDYLNKWIMQQLGDGHTYRVVRIRTIVEPV